MRRYLILIIAILLLSSVNALVFTVTEGQLVKLKLNAYDPDGAPLTYNFTPPLNEKGEWQTKIGDAGTYNIIITVSDGEKVSKEGLTLIINPKEKVEEPKKEIEEKTKEVKEIEEKVEEIKEEIKEINHPPKLEKIKDITVTEGYLVKISPTAVDEDNDEIKYGFAYPLNDKGEWQTKIGDSGEYVVTVTATDQKSVDSKTFKIIVKKKKNEISFEEIKDIKIKENEEINLELKASAEEENIEYSAENLLEGATLSGNKFYFKPDYNYVGRNLFINLLGKIYPYVPKKSETATFIAKSRSDEKKQKVKITVFDVNRIPKLEIDDLTLNEGEKINFNPIINDEDGDWLNIKYSGEVKNNYQTNFDDAGEYKVKVTVDDAFDSVSKDIKITINDVKKNNAPSLSPLDFREVNEGEELSFKISASDPDKDKLNYYVVEGPGSIKEDVFSWQPGFDFVKNNEQNLISKIKYFNKKIKQNKEVAIKIKVSDGNLTDESSFNILVFNINQKPEIVNFEPEDNIIVAKGGRVVFSVDVNDLDNDELIYTWNFGFMNNLEAENTIARTFTRKGKKEIKVTISDGIDGVEKEWKVRVI